jgi:hypothetical protein
MKTIPPTLFCVSDPPLIIGNLSYKIIWQTNNEIKIPKVVKCRDLKDEFYDEFYEVTIEAPVHTKVNLLYFMKSNADHGFSYLDQSGSVLSDFFSNSWIRSTSQNQFLCFDSIEKELENIALFPGKIYDGLENTVANPIEMVIHRPSNELLTEFRKGKEADVNRFYCLSPLLSDYEKIKKDHLVEVIFELTQYCEFVSFWLHGPDRPLLLSKDIDSVMNSISNSCKNNSVNFEKIDSEENVPVW